MPVVSHDHIRWKCPSARRVGRETSWDSVRRFRRDFTTHISLRLCHPFELPERYHICRELVVVLMYDQDLLWGMISAIICNVASSILGDRLSFF
jgi:hypothetical protein